jgi:hypothetical protein
VTKATKYEAPAVELRENVAGLLLIQNGSYCPPDL